MMSGINIIALAYSNGKMIQGEEGAMYDGPDPTMFRVTSLATFEVLKQKIHSVLNLEAANQEVSKVTYRFPISANKYRLVQLKSDDDVKYMFSNHAQHPNLSAIELFIDMNPRQTRLSQTSAGDRSRSQLTVMAARERTIRCSKPVNVSQVPPVYNVSQLAWPNWCSTLLNVSQLTCPIRYSEPENVSQVPKLYNASQLIYSPSPLRNDYGLGILDSMIDDQRRRPSLGARQTRGSLQGGSLGSGRRARGK